MNDEPKLWKAMAIPGEYPVVFEGNTAIANTYFFSSSSIKCATLEKAKQNARLIATSPELLDALRVLGKIADAYDANELDDEARKHWGLNNEHINQKDPSQIGLYFGRGGKTLLTLEDCFKAREIIAKAVGSKS